MDLRPHGPESEGKWFRLPRRPIAPFSAIFFRSTWGRCWDLDPLPPCIPATGMCSMMPAQADPEGGEGRGVRGRFAGIATGREFRNQVKPPRAPERTQPMSTHSLRAATEQARPAERLSVERFKSSCRQMATVIEGIATNARRLEPKNSPNGPAELKKCG